jgi:hypothetical protein
MTNTIDEQPTDPELLLYHLDFNRSTIERALDITAEYVATHKLILTGGTAIDMALRSKGTSIYDENALPDYDIISDNNLKHATALAEILCKEGIRDINVINAIHITTSRVRVKNVTLLDATYLPETLMKRIPYIDIGRYRLVHPHYQLIDQRLSLSTLMADTGVSLNIFNRLAKDLKRNQILREHFNTQEFSAHCAEACSDNSTVKVFTTRVKLDRKHFMIDQEHMNRIDPNCFIYTGDTCVSGFLAYALYYHEYMKSHKALDGTIDPHVLIDSEYIEFDLPEGSTVSILNCSDKAEQTLRRISNSQGPIKKFNALANLKPITLSIGHVEVTDTYGARYGAVELEGMVVASTDYILMQFLRDRVYADKSTLRATNSLYYESILNMVLDMQQHAESSKVWFPSISCYGYAIIPEYRAFALEKIMDADLANKMKPKNSYLRIPACQTKSDFDHSASHYFAIDGQQNDSILHTNLKYISRQIQTKIDG